MIQTISLEQWNELNEPTRQFILTWKKRKYGNVDPRLSIGECWEFLVATTRNHHTDSSDGKFYNHMLLNEESVFAWDGEEPIDILWYEVKEAAKHQLILSGTFNEES